MGYRRQKKRRKPPGTAGIHTHDRAENQNQITDPNQGREESRHRNGEAHDNRNDSGARLQETKTMQRIGRIAARRASKRRREDLKYWIDCVAALATVAIAFLTAAYVHYSRAQWSVMEGQLAASQNAEGAHMGIGEFEGSIDNGEIGIPIENYGRIPSPRTYIFVHVYKFTNKSPVPIYSKDYNFGGDRTEIPPGSGKYGVTVPLELSPGEIERLQSQQERLEIFTVLKYDNGFGRILQPGFCFAYTPLNSKRWNACPEGVVNFADLQKVKPGQPMPTPSVSPD
jgi:hypothetical protein